MKTITREQSPSVDEANFWKRGEICLSMILAHYMLGETCPNIMHGYFIIWRNVSLFERRFLKWEKFVPLHIKCDMWYPHQENNVWVLIKPNFKKQEKFVSAWYQLISWWEKYVHYYKWLIYHLGEFFSLWIMSFRIRRNMSLFTA